LTSLVEQGPQGRYVDSGEVLSLSSFFAVPKGLDEIRIVYDRAKSGLNNNIWVPSFPLATINTHLKAVDGDRFMSNMGNGEIFRTSYYMNQCRPCGEST
jgi:hypothetical protein